MEQFDRKLQLSDFTKIPMDIFRRVGICLFKTYPDEEKPLKEKLTFIMVMINLVYHIIFVNAIFFFGTFSSPVELTAFACYEGFILNSSFKMIAVWNGRSVLHEVISEMEKIFPRTDKEIAEYRLAEYYKKIELYTRLIAIYHFTTITMFNLFPVAQSTFEYIIFGGDFKIRFPFIVYYPFDETQPILYTFAYIYQAMAGYIFSSFFIGANLLLISLVHFISMHFNYLANWISNYEPNGTEQNVNDLKRFIQHHRNILRLSFKINEVFNVAILMNYIASCGVICMIALQISIGTEILDMLKFFAFLISSLVHVYFICYFGTDLLKMSAALSDAVFAHRWYLGNKKYRKMLPLIIARAHKPAFLTAFKFFIVSMETFKTLITTSYQFFTLIKTKYSEEE